VSSELLLPFTHCHIFQLEVEKREEEVWCYYQHEWDQFSNWKWKKEKKKFGVIINMNGINSLENQNGK
jgi:hypothetical protein